MKKQSRKRAGETLTETLVSLLITALAMLMLPGAIVASARVDKTVEEQVLLTDGTDAENVATMNGTVTVTDNYTTPKKSKSYDVTITRYGERSGLYEYVQK